MASPPRLRPKGPAEPTMSGSASGGTPNRSSRGGDHRAVLTSINWVREALPTSIRCSPVKRCTIHASTVPRHKSPREARVRSGSKRSSSHRAFVAENIGSSGRPLYFLTASAAWAYSRHIGAVRWSCQLISGERVSPVSRSQSSKDSRWVLSPMPASLPGSVPRKHSRADVPRLRQISAGDCSTHPRWGWWTGRSAAARATTSPT